jgi:ABC-2 type transport system ATP-binding protein
VVLFEAAQDAGLLAEHIRTRFHVDTTVLENQVRIEHEGAHRFVTEVVEAFPGEIQALSISKPALEDVFIRRTGHKFWSETTEAEAEKAKSTSKGHRR